jgi:ERCC4-type nuclease
LSDVASGAIARKGERPQNKRRFQLNILRELPGIGASRAQTLLDRFSTVAKVMQAGY